jgi:hypothetical protein
VNDHLLTPEDLKRITGMTRYSKQVEWFKLAFGVKAVCSFDGRPIITWATFEALNAKHFGLSPVVPPKKRIVLESDKRLQFESEKKRRQL